MASELAKSSGPLPTCGDRPRRPTLKTVLFGSSPYTRRSPAAHDDRRLLALAFSLHAEMVPLSYRGSKSIRSLLLTHGGNSAVELSIFT